MGVGLLENALSGLQAFQRSLETTSNNIANANNDGYSRQRAELASRREQFMGYGFVGNGVQVTTIARNYDQFITNQVRSSRSAFGEADAFSKLAAQVDNIIADEATGLSPALKSFFDAAHAVSNDPTSIPARQALVSETGILAQNFNTMGTRLTELRKQLNTDIDNKLADINQYAKSIAELNLRISTEMGRTGGKQQPNGLLDQRDLLLSKISENIDVTLANQSDGTVSVFIGQGQPLVIGTFASSLSSQGSAEDPFHHDIMLNGQNATNQITGGQLKGYLRFRDELLDPAQQQMGLLSAGMAVEVNRVNQAGFDLNGAAGGAIFNLGSPQIPVSSNNSSSIVTATFTNNATNLAASDYRVTVTGTGPTAYTLTRLSDNSNVTLPSTNAGFNLSFDGTESVGDSFLVRPTFAASLTINSTLSDPRKLAASQSAASVPGDNRNALALVGLETQKNLLGGKASFQDAYGQLLSDAGTVIHAAQITQSAQDTLLKQATSTQQTISGVNLDEEAANLIKFQNAYQASARVVSVVNTIFDALMSSVR